WGDPIKVVGEDGGDGEDGIDGLDGAYVSFVYKNAATQPTAPSGGSWDGSNETFPSGWTDDPTAPAEGEVTWVSKARYYDNGSSWVNAGWGTPSKWYEKGGDGEDGIDGIDGAYVSF